MRSTDAHKTAGHVLPRPPRSKLSGHPGPAFRDSGGMTGLSLHLATNCPGSGIPGEIVSRTIRLVLQTTLQKHQDRLSLAFAGVLCSFQINRQISTLSQVSRLLAFTPSTTAHVFERLRNIKSTMTKQPPTTPTKPLITRDFNHSQTRSSSKDLSSQFQPLQQALHHVSCGINTTIRKASSP